MSSNETFAEIFGEEVFKKVGEKEKTEAVLNASEFIGIYFGAHWAPPCRLFTTNLEEIYNEINKEKKVFEVVFVSKDGNKAAFERNHAKMPWAAVDYEDSKRIDTI